MRLHPESMLGAWLRAALIFAKLAYALSRSELSGCVALVPRSTPLDGRRLAVLHRVEAVACRLHFILVVISVRLFSSRDLVTYGSRHVSLGCGAVTFAIGFFAPVCFAGGLFALMSGVLALLLGEALLSGGRRLAVLGLSLVHRLVP